MGDTAPTLERGPGGWWIVVLSWNGRRHTLECLRALAAIDRADVRVVCVDNGSSDGSPDAVRAEFPDVVLIENGTNLGYAGGNNVGIRHALAHGASWVVLLNNDAILDPGAIDAFEAAARDHPRAGALGGKLLFRDPPDRIWFAGQRFNALLGYAGRPRGYGKPDGPRYNRVGPTDRAAGALMAVPRSTVDMVGLLDDDLFAYVEDVDWSLRVRNAGLEVLFVPRALAWHHVSASTGGERGSTHALYYGVRNTITVCERHRPLPRPFGALRRWLVLLIFLAQALLLSEGRRPFSRAVLEGYADVRVGRLGPRPERAAT